MYVCNRKQIKNSDMRTKSSFQADQLAERLGFKQVSSIALNDAVKLACPFSMEKIKTQNRGRDLVMWRHAILCAFAMNGVKVIRAGKMFNRDHATVLHSIKTASNELDINFTDGVVGNIRLIMHYAAKQQVIYQEQRKGFYCKKVEFKIENYANRL